MNFNEKQNELIADFLGIPRGERLGSSSKAPSSLANIIEQVNDYYQLNRESPEQILVNSWHDIFGGLSERCFPVRINGKNQLVISVSNPTLRSEIAFRKSFYLEKIQALRSCEHIKGITILG